MLNLEYFWPQAFWFKYSQPLCITLSRASDSDYWKDYIIIFFVQIIILWKVDVPTSNTDFGEIDLNYVV